MPREEVLPLGRHTLRCFFSQALHSAFDRSRAAAITISAMLGHLTISGAYKKVLKASRLGYERLALFPMLTFLHDALHAGLNSGKRSFNRAFTMSKALDLDVVGGRIEKCISTRLTGVFVYNGKPTNAAGQYIVGDFVALVVKQFRGAQYIDAISARVWEASRSSVCRATEPLCPGPSHRVSAGCTAGAPAPRFAPCGRSGSRRAQGSAKVIRHRPRTRRHGLYCVCEEKYTLQGAARFILYIYHCNAIAVHVRHHP